MICQNGAALPIAAELLDKPDVLGRHVVSRSQIGRSHEKATLPRYAGPGAQKLLDGAAAGFACSNM